MIWDKERLAVVVSRCPSVHNLKHVLFYCGRGVGRVTLSSSGFILALESPPIMMLDSGKLFSCEEWTWDCRS